MKVFGIRRSVLDGDLEFVETPVGVRCGHCDEPIVAGDDGWMIPHVDVPDQWTEKPYHRACHVRQIIGSVAHQQKRCSCYVASSAYCDDPALTRRQAAQAAEDYFYASQRTRPWT